MNNCSEKWISENKIFSYNYINETKRYCHSCNYNRHIIIANQKIELEILNSS